MSSELLAIVHGSLSVLPAMSELERACIMSDNIFADQAVLQNALSWHLGQSARTALQPRRYLIQNRNSADRQCPTKDESKQPAVQETNKTSPKTNLVQKVGGLNKLWPERVKSDLNALQLPVEALRQGAEASPDGVKQRVNADGVLQVTFEHLERRT